MANIKSAIKRMRQNEKRRLANRQKMSRMRTEIKKFRRLLNEGQVDEARTLLPRVYAVIDRTAQRGVIHSNTASRYKSRLTRTLNRHA
ncbi:MAG TPA: 30S ribosomal protein S20 [Acidobacteriota bacterium]|nr:30S ribosomal protein S20 [Acidobacteriota bacterium]